MTPAEVHGLGLDARLRPHGQAGVERLIRCLLAEFDLTLALSGHAGPGSVGTADLVEEP